MSPRRTHGKPGITRAGGAEIITMIGLATKIGLPVMTGPAMKNDTIAKTVARKAEEKRGGRREKTPFCYFHGKDQGHWTNECPITIERKAELERQNALSAKPVNYTS